MRTGCSSTFVWNTPLIAVGEPVERADPWLLTLAGEHF